MSEEAVVASGVSGVDSTATGRELPKGTDDNGVAVADFPAKKDVWQRTCSIETWEHAPQETVRPVGGAKPKGHRGGKPRRECGHGRRFGRMLCPVALVDKKSILECSQLQRY